MRWNSNIPNTVISMIIPISVISIQFSALELVIAARSLGVSPHASIGNPWLKTHMMNYHTTHLLRTLSWKIQPLQKPGTIWLMPCSSGKLLPLEFHLLAPWQKSTPTRTVRTIVGLTLYVFLISRTIVLHCLKKVVSHICSILELLSVGGYGLS